MEISVGNSGGSNTKSLDLKTLFTSEVSNNGESVKKGTSSWLDNGEEAETKKRKSTKEVTISSFEDLTESKRIKHSIDDIEVDEADSCSVQSSGLGQKINGGGGFNAIGISIGGDNHGVLIPKRPRGTVGRSKFVKSHLLKPSSSSDSFEKDTKLKDEVLHDEVSVMDEPMDDGKASSVEQIVKLNGNSGVNDGTNLIGMVDSEGNPKQESTTVTSSDHAKNDADVLELLQNKVSDADVQLSSSSLGFKDQLSNIKTEIDDETPQSKVPGADAPVSSNSTSDMDKLNESSITKPRNNVNREGIDGLDVNQKQTEDSTPVSSSHLEKDEEGTDLVSNVNDSSSKRNRRKRKYLGSSSDTVAKKVESTVDLDPDDDLEQNAARMLSSRFDPSCIGFASKNRTSALLSMNGEKPSPSASDLDPDSADRALRPRRQQKGKGTSRKRRHFYEIHSDDMDAHWFLNRRIKIFWPLDESWYYGLVNKYDAEKNLHHIKYDDRDEEWISLENERFKLLLHPNEVPCKDKDKDSDTTHKKEKGTRSFHIKDEAFMATHMETEPIISWLTRSSHRAKSSSSKKQKQSHFSNGNIRETDKPNCSSVFFNTSKESSNSSEGHLPIVYVRRRNRRFHDASCVPFIAWSLNSIGVLKLDSALIESKKFEVHVSLWPMLTYVLGVDTLWLFSRVLLLHYGTMVTMWPTVFLEVLFVDNIVGLRLFLFEGCLKQAVTFVFMVMKVFCGSEKFESVDHQVPMTSIRFKLSFFQNFRNQKVFAYYSFSKVKECDWRYIDSEFQPCCLLTRQLALSECTYDNVKQLEGGINQSQIPVAGQTACFEVFDKKSSPIAIGSSRSPYRPSTIYSLKNGNLPPFALSFSAAPNFFLSLHLQLLLEQSITSFSLQDHDSVPPLDTFVPLPHSDDDHLEVSSQSLSRTPSLEPPTIDESPRKSTQLVLDPIPNVNSPSASSPKSPQIPPVKLNVEIPTPGADVAWNLSDDIICSPSPSPSPYPTARDRNKSGPGSSSFIDPLNSWADGKTDFIGNGFGNGPKKPRTQVQYSLPSREFNLKNKGHNNLPYQRIRKANDKKPTDATKGPRRNLELAACDANILINGGDKGWRECGAKVFLEVADQNEWKLAVKCRGVLKYGYKVHQDLQPGSTNRYTHAMMWKGGKDWALEFPDRSQWFLFKEMHEECHNRNIRAASIKNIPIPGVRLIEDSVDDDEDTPFVRSSWYFRQVRNDVEMAMDGSRVMYDMDSEDEEWVRERRLPGLPESEAMSDEVFEKVMDMLEKVSFAQKRDEFSSGEIEELVARVSHVKEAKSVYEHWREKRQRKGMPLIRQLQPPLWERYQQICREWDQSQPKLTAGTVSGSHSHSHSQEKASAGDNKPPMFAFCLKPRGLELLNKGSKHRPHKKISLSGHSHAFLGDHDTPHSSGRRANTYVFGDDRAESSDVSPLLSRMYSPRDATGPTHFSLDGGDTSSDWNHQLRLQRTTPKTIKPLISPRPIAPPSTFRKPGKRNHNNGKRPNNPFPDWHNHPSPPYRHPSQLLLGGSDLDEFRLRDASSAAKHARNMAKLKRERAQKLMLSADLAIHKAVSALMTAEAIKAMKE